MTLPLYRQTCGQYTVYDPLHNMWDRVLWIFLEYMGQGIITIFRTFSCLKIANGHET